MPEAAHGPSAARRIAPSRREFLALAGAGAVAAGLAACTAGSEGPGPGATTGPTPRTYRFPEEYLWGVATSAYQIEGSTRADGRGTSIWDTFALEPSHITDASSGEPADDHYRRWRSDLDLLADLEVTTYRFSVAWPRIQPTGSGPALQRGLDFYRGLVDALVERDIRPAITLYHWDLPQSLQDAGGWPERDTAKRFADYAALVYEALGPRLGSDGADWLTVNEPKSVAFNGYWYGSHAPGLTDPDAAAAAVHHQLLGHGLAVQAFRASGAPGRVGPALNLLPVLPGLDAEPAARRVDARENRLFLDPVLLGSYPDEAIGSVNGQLPASPERFRALVRDTDLATISTPSDLLGVNDYGVMAVDQSGDPANMYPTSDATWQQVHPEGLYDLLVRIKDDYPAIPILITENGMPDQGGNLTTDDPYRTDFLRDHFVSAGRALAAGVPLLGHHVWSLFDNYEWNSGYTQRWGVVAVDFDTQRRTPKKSAAYLTSVIRARAVTA